MFSTLRVLLVAAAVSAVFSACPTSEWKEYDGVCYWKSDYTANWRDAREACCSSLLFHSDLASIHNLDQDAFIATDILDGLSGWIGMHCGNGTASSCRWTDGTPYDFPHWYGSPTPNGDCTSGECCAVINYSRNDGDWYGIDCYDEYWPFVCQLNAS